MGKKIELSRKTITEDKDGNALITGKVTAESSPVDAKDLTNKEYVDNAIAQASIDGEVDTSGFALKTELPTKTSQLTNDSGFITSIPNEYVTNNELQQMSEGFNAELNKKSDILNYNDHTLNEIETYNNFEKVLGGESQATYIINKSINLIRETVYSIEIKFNDNTNLLWQGEATSTILQEKQVNYIVITNAGILELMLIDKVKYSINNGIETSEHDDNASSLLVYHPNANNVISLTITRPTAFEIDNNFFINYQFVNDAEKESWNNKADKSELFSGDYNDLSNKPTIPSIDGLASENFVKNEIAKSQSEIEGGIVVYLQDYATKDNLNLKADKTEIPNIDGLATEVYVDNAMAELREEMVVLEEDDLTIDGLVDESFPSLTTEDKTLIGAINEINSENESLQNQMNELFQNVSSGKELIASAITDKGVDASEEETFQSLSEKINQIPVGPPGSNIIGYVNENNDIYVSLTELESGTYTLKFEDYTGLLNEFDDIGTVEV